MAPEGRLEGWGLGLQLPDVDSSKQQSNDKACLGSREGWGWEVGETAQKQTVGEEDILLWGGTSAEQNCPKSVQLQNDDLGI